MNIVREIYSIPTSLEVIGKQFHISVKIGAELEMIFQSRDNVEKESEKYHSSSKSPSIGIRTFSFIICINRSNWWPAWFEEAVSESLIKGMFWSQRDIRIRLAGSTSSIGLCDNVDSKVKFTMEYDESNFDVYQRRRLIDSLTVNLVVSCPQDNRTNDLNSIMGLFLGLLQCLNVCVACLVIDQLQQRVPLFRCEIDHNLDFYSNRISNILQLDVSCCKEK